MTENEQDLSQWHLDKRVPLALILTMAAQVFVVIWGAAVMFKDIEINREGVISARQGLDRLDARMTLSERGAAAQAVQLGRIEEITSATQRNLDRLLQVVEERRGPPWADRP